MNVNDHEIKEILKSFQNICVLGLSPETSKPSHGVPLFMKNKGFNVVGVYPKGDETAGMKIYSKLADVPLEQRKFINVFRKSESIPEVVDEILNLGGCEVLWLQLGISHAQAEKKAEEAGLKVISNRCLKIEHHRFF